MHKKIEKDSSHVTNTSRSSELFLGGSPFLYRFPISRYFVVVGRDDDFFFTRPSLFQKLTKMKARFVLTDIVII